MNENVVYESGYVSLLAPIGSSVAALIEKSTGRSLVVSTWLLRSLLDELEKNAAVIRADDEPF